MEIFSLAAVRLVMQHEDIRNGPFEDDDDEDMTAGQRGFYSGSGFALHREMRQLPEFANRVKDEILRCLCERDRAVKRKRNGCHSEISVPRFTDPLDGSFFEI